ncbi:phosphotransferase [Actinophytocola sp.]|uniref:phosphotransferase n=1 Tax=Actinophytocola sp. TaxID=1872138 RepID=UPI002ED0CCBE
MERTVSAIVTDGDRCVGSLGPFAVAVPWWAEVEPVVDRLRESLGVPAYVLRLLRVDGGDGARDGHVTYHVEAPGTAAVLPAATLVTYDEPLRSPWASAAGLRELFDWARDNVRVTGPVEQRKTWNLAGLFRLPTADGPVWLKATPGFAADEARVIAAFAAVDPTLVPTVLAAAPGRMLLADLPGEDGWDAPEAVLANGIHRFVRAQSALDTRPSWLTARDDMGDEVRALLTRDLGLTAEEVAAAHALLPRWAELADCGLPNTIVHGDFHSGNWRGEPPVILDFADAHFGNPVIDGLRVMDFLATPAKKAAARAAWIEAWRQARPESDPARALAVAEPLAHLYYAVRYQEFLDGIEESEQIYHRGDPASSVRAALGI